MRGRVARRASRLLWREFRAVDPLNEKTRDCGAFRRDPSSVIAAQ
jgi:hypothetical protein